MTESSSSPSVSSHAETKNLFLEAAMLCAAVLVVLSVGGVMKRRNFHYFGETALCMVIGLTLGLLFRWFTHSDLNENILDKDIQLSANFFYMVLLPPIIFEAAFTLQRMTFFKNILVILSLAFIGGFYSAIFVSGLMWLFTRFLPYKLTMVESLVYGSLISSTDPVTILAMLPSSVDKKLYMLIFGESALNDAVAIILYRFFTELADPTVPLGFSALLTSALSSIAVFVGSFAVGVVVALAFALLTKYVKMPDGSVYELAMLMIFAYMSYLMAELFHLTGIVSIFFCGSAMSHYAYNNLSEVTILSAKMVLRTLSSICESFIFLYLGLGLVAFGEKKTIYDPAVIVCSLISILVARTHVFFICGSNNILNPSNHIPLNHMILMWFGGLRGAVAFALAVQLLDNSFFSETARSLLFGTTMITVFVTVLGLGSLTPLVIKKLGLAGDAEWEEVGGGDGREEEGKADEKAGNDIDELIKENQEVPEEEGHSRSLFYWLYLLDRKVLKPFFAHPQSARARRLGLETAEDEKEQAEDAIATAGMPGALANIVKQDSLKDLESLASRAAARSRGSFASTNPWESAPSPSSSSSVACRDPPHGPRGPHRKAGSFAGSRPGSRRPSVAHPLSAVVGSRAKDPEKAGSQEDGFEEIQMTAATKGLEQQNE